MKVLWLQSFLYEMSEIIYYTLYAHSLIMVYDINM